jgi:NADPH:quinone reductase-like Zn-dependent oxidoreductase
VKAVRIHEHGDADTLRYEDCPEPKLTGPCDAIVKLQAASINRRDIGNRRGTTGSPAALPHVLGADGAGVVAEVGRDVNNVKPGDRVCLYPLRGCGRCEFCATARVVLCGARRILGDHEHGTYAGYVKVPARNCFPIPSGLTFAAAAALPSAYVTVWEMLMTHAELKPGEHVLLVGVGGGVGSAALQLAVGLGARVIAISASDEKLARAKELGAEQTVNYKNSDFAEEARRLTGKRGVDVVVDSAGGEGWVRSLAALARGGRLVTCGATAGVHPRTDVTRIFWNNLKIFGATLGSRQAMAKVIRFMENTRAKPVLDRIFPLKDAAAAQRRLEEGKQFGKIVLEMDG